MDVAGGERSGAEDGGASDGAVRAMRDSIMSRQAGLDRSIPEGAGRGENAESIERWEQTFAGSTRGIAIADPVSEIIRSVNPQFAAMHGGSVEDFVEKSLGSVVGAESRSEAAELADRLDRDGHICAERGHVRLDGATFPVAVEAMMTRNAAGALLEQIWWCEDLTERRAADEAQLETREMFEAAFADAPNGVALIGLDAHFLRVNSALCEMLGRSSTELVGTATIEYCHPDDRAATRGAYIDMTVAGEPVSIEKRYLRPDGTVIWAFCRGIIVRDRHGEPRYIVTHFIDFTARKLAEERQAEAQQRFETAFSAAPIGMALVALDGRWIKVNRTLCELTGYSEAQMLELSFQAITHPDDLDADLSRAERLLAGEIDRYTMEKRHITSDGQVIWVNLAVSLVRDFDGHPLHFIRQLEAISERKRLEESLQHLADHDALTGLWNRRRFGQELRREVERGQRYGEGAALLLIDLDGFKRVNDTHGHRCGDELLKCVAAALRARLRVTDSLARLGGDEFGVILTGVDSDNANALALALCEVVSNACIPVNGDEIAVTASVGVASLDRRTASDEVALEQADRAMYHDKAAHTHR